MSPPFPAKPKNIRRVYLDHAAATPMDPRVFVAMRPWLVRNFANPSALYADAVEARNAVETSRKAVADILHAQPDTTIFTSGGTESCNLAIFGAARADQLKAKHFGHIVTTHIEHKAVLEPIRQLEKDGWKVTYLPVDNIGQVLLDDFKKFLRKDTALVSIMVANNEIGTIQPIAEIGLEILKWRKKNKTPCPYFHTDACQAAGYLDLSVDRLHVDMLSLNGGKIYGPKGVGILYKRRGVPLEPIMHGGGQEMGFRSGTENVPAVVGFSKALELIEESRIKNKELGNLRDYFWEQIRKNIPDVSLNGPLLGKEGRGVVDRLPNNLNVSFEGVDAEALILYLDAYGIVCSSGSACTADSDEVSHVLTACGISKDAAKSSIRFTLGKETKKKDIAYVMRYLPSVVKELRRSSLIASISHDRAKLKL